MTNSPNSWNKFILDTQDHPEKFGALVHKAVKRHLDDLSQVKKKDFPYYFDEAKAEKIISFIKKLRQSKGQFYNKPFELLPWQCFILACLFGWVKKATHSRRFTQADIEVGRKNGKTTLISGISLFLLLCEEKGANLYCGANSREQAHALYSQVEETVAVTPGLSRYLKAQTNSIKNPRTFSYLKKVSSEVRNLDGLSVSCAVVDEIATMKNSRLWDVLRGGMGSRLQPLIFGISSASTDKTTFGFKMREYTKKVLTGEHEDQTHFGIIFTLDEEDDPDDKKTWIKSNPSMGLTVQMEELEAHYNSVSIDEAGKQDFIAKRLNVYSANVTSWIPERYWRERITKRPQIELKTPVIVGMDLSKSGDFSALTFTYPTLGNYSEFKFYLPEKHIEKRIAFENPLYRRWINDGFITLCGGELIDYNRIGADILEHTEGLSLECVFYDAWGSAYLKRFFDDNEINHQPFAQSMRNMSPASLNLERAVKAGGVSIQENPVFLWMATNAQVWTDINGNIKVQKGQDRLKRIDGVITLIMAYQKALEWQEEKLNNSGEINTDLFFV